MIDIAFLDILVIALVASLAADIRMKRRNKS